MANKIAIGSLIVAAISVLVSIFSGSNKEGINYNSSPHIEKAQKVEINYVTNKKAYSENIDWKIYNNIRFGFTVKYPSHWETGANPDNSDGLLLFMGDPDIDIRAYAGFYMPGFTCYDSIEKASTNKQIIELATGEKEAMYINKVDTNIEYCMSFVDSDIQYNFRAKVTKDFFEENKTNIIKLAKSFNYIEGAER